MEHACIHVVVHEEHAPFAVPLHVVLHPLEHPPVQVVLHPPVHVVLHPVEHPPVQVELQLEQVAVFAVPVHVVEQPPEHPPVHNVLHPPVQVVLQPVEQPPEQVELQLEQPLDVAVPVHVVEHPPEQPDEQSEEQEEQLDEVDDPEQLDEQSEEQEAQLDDELFVQVLRQSVTFGSIFSPQLFSTVVNVLPSATKPRKGTAFVTIVLKKSLRQIGGCSFFEFPSSFILTIFNNFVNVSFSRIVSLFLHYVLAAFFLLVQDYC